MFIFCLLILKLRCFVVVLVFGQKSIISVLLVFSEILFSLNHWTIWERSWLIYLFIFLSDLCDNIVLAGVILETEGSILKIQKRLFLTAKKLKKGTPNLTSPYGHSLFIIVLIKQIFETNKSSRAASRSRTQF